VLGALLPAAIAVAASGEFREVEWPATALAWFFRTVALVEWTLVATLTPAVYFLLVLLLFGARRQPIARTPALVAGFTSSAVVALLLVALTPAQSMVAGCAASTLAAITLLALTPRASTRPSARIESLGSRRGSQPFAFGLTAAAGAIAAVSLRALTANKEWTGVTEFMLGLPFLVGFSAILLGAIFALGAGLGAIFRRGAAPAAPYGVVAGCVSAVVAGLLGREFVDVRNAILLCSLAAGLLGTLTAAGPSGFVRRTQRRGPRCA
jgi:hypothetical protein